MKLLLVEDEKDVALALVRALERNGYPTDIAETGSQAIELLEVTEYDLMVLDLNLPDVDGLEVCRTARELRPKLLILVLSARGRKSDIVAGLDQGADDYLGKPYNLGEILARIRALLRRDLRCRDPLIRIKDICIDLAERAVWKGEHRLQLTRKEFAILEYLMRHPGEVVSQEDLLDHVWCSNVNFFSNTVRVHILSLRRKLGDDREEPIYIATVLGEGYRFINPDQEALD